MLLKSVVIKRWGYIQHQQPQKTTRNELITSSRLIPGTSQSLVIINTM